MDKLAKSKRQNSEFQNFIVKEMTSMNELLASKKGQNDSKKNHLTQLFNSFTKKLQYQNED